MPLTNARSQLTRQTATEWVIDWRQFNKPKILRGYPDHRSARRSQDFRDRRQVMKIGHKIRTTARGRSRITLCSSPHDVAMRRRVGSRTKSSNCVDPRVGIQIQRRSTTEQSTLTRFVCGESTAQFQAPFNEKEIRFPISILQTSPLIRGFALLRRDYDRSVCAATHSVWLCCRTAHCAGPISKRNASVPQAKPVYGGLVGRQPRPLRQHLDRRV